MESVKRFLNRLKNNWKMKLVSLVLAVFLWNSVIVNTDPEVSRTTDSIPITIIGETQLADKGLAIATESSEYLQSVKVTVLMTRSQAKLFDPSDNDINVTLDLNKITETGEQVLKVSVYSNEVTIDRVAPESFTVIVDEKESKIVSIEADVTGDLPEGYFEGESAMEPTSVQVTGPSSIVELVDKAVFTIDLTDRTSSILVPKEIQLVDAEGNVIDSDTLTTNVNSAMFEMNIQPRKQIQILWENCVSGMDKLPEGYQVEEVEIYPETVEVTGNDDLLAGLTSLPSEVIDIAGKNEDVYTTLKLLAPEGVTLLSVDTISLIIRISEIMEKAQFQEQSVELRNMPKGYSVEDFEEIRNVEMLVPYNTISTLTESHVKLFIDLADLTAGEHELKIQCEVPEEFRAEEIVIENDMATVIMVEDN